MIPGLLNNHKTKTITLYNKVQVNANGALAAPTWVLYKSVSGLYWKATGSKPNVSDKYKEQVTACVIVDPAVLTEAEVTTAMKINVSDEGDYVLVYPDDIGGQGKVLQLNLKEWK